MTDPLNEDISLDALINRTTPVLLNQDLSQGAEIYRSPQVDWGELLASQPRLQQPVYTKEQEAFTPKLQSPLYRPQESSPYPVIQPLETPTQVTQSLDIPNIENPETTDSLDIPSLTTPQVTQSLDIPNIENPVTRESPSSPLNIPPAPTLRTPSEERSPLTYQQIQAQRREAYQAEMQWRREHATEIRAARARGIRLEPPWKRPQTTEQPMDMRQFSEMLGGALRQLTEGVNLLDGSQLSGASGRRDIPEPAAPRTEQARQQGRNDTTYRDTSVVRIAPGTVIRILDDRLVVE